MPKILLELIYCQLLRNTKVYYERLSLYVQIILVFFSIIYLQSWKKRYIHENYSSSLEPGAVIQTVNKYFDLNFLLSIVITKTEIYKK